MKGGKDGEGRKGGHAGMDWRASMGAGRDKSSECECLMTA